MMDFVKSAVRKEIRSLPKDCKAAIGDVEERLEENPTKGGENYDVTKVGSQYLYEQQDPHLVVYYEYDQKAERITFLTVRTRAIENPFVFISYAHKDRSALEEIKDSFEAFDRSKLEFWTDKEIRSGEKWNEKIHKKLLTALAALLLVSEHFLQSEYIRKNELPVLLEEPNFRLLWLKVSACQPQRFRLGKKLLEYQAVLDPKEPLDEIPDRQRKKKLEKLQQEIVAAVLDPLLSGARSA